MDAQAATARQAFPNGLHQPGGGYRFSLDPLLLAAFLRPKKNVRLADLGTGCGVAALYALMLHPAIRGALGLDMDPDMARCAQDNADLLGLAERYRSQVLDVADVRQSLEPEGFGLVVANPPYRRPGTGLPCKDQARTRARFESGAGLEDFTRAASWLLANRGAFAAVFPAQRLGELMEACRGARLAPKRLCCVHSRLEEPARLVLLEAVKNGGEDMRVEPPLVLYQGQGDSTRMSAAALAFCPALAANP